MTEQVIEAYTHGKFVWFELVTDDVKKAGDYYAELFNWRIEEDSMGGGVAYHLIHVGDGGHVGGIMENPAAGQVPSHWNNYVTVPDVDAYAKKAEAAGGKILVPPTDIPEAGRFSTVSDPAGATITLWRSSKPNTEPAKQMPDVGETCWFELMTTDVEGAKAFYSELFGWTIEKSPMEGMDYWMAKRGDHQTCGIVELPEKAKAQNVPPYWLAYVRVENLEDTNTRAKKMGGSELVPATKIPTIGTFAVYAGPTGATLAHFEGESASS